MINKRICIYMFWVVLLLSGCSGLIAESDSKMVGVSISEPNRIQFQGKGAGAGFALMSTMGSMGVALGVAIDEGIAKEIREAAYAAGFSIEDSIRQGVQAASDGVYIVGYDKVIYPISVRIKRYGFYTSGANGDQTSAEIQVEITRGNEGVISIHYPNDFGKQVGNDIKTFSLGELKKNGALSKYLLDMALVAVFDRAFKSSL